MRLYPKLHSVLVDVLPLKTFAIIWFRGVGVGTESEIFDVSRLIGAREVLVIEEGHIFDFHVHNIFRSS